MSVRHRLPAALRSNGSIQVAAVWLPGDRLGSHTLDSAFKTGAAAFEVSLPRRLKQPPHAGCDTRAAEKVV